MEINTPENEKEARDLLRTVSSPGWEMPTGVEKALPLMIWQLVVEKTKSGSQYKYAERTRLRAAMILMKMESDNVQRETDSLPDVILHGNLEDFRDELLSQPEYLEFLRNRDLYGDPGDVREEGEQGPMEASRPSQQD